MTTIDTNEFFTTREFAEKVGLSTDTVKIHCQRKIIQGVKVAHVWLIPKTELVRYRKERRQAGRPAAG